MKDRIIATKIQQEWPGYDASERTFVINPAEAETVRRIFALYLDLGVSGLIGAAAYPKIIVEVALIDAEFGEALLKSRETLSRAERNFERPDGKAFLLVNRAAQALGIPAGHVGQGKPPFLDFQELLQR